MTTGTQTMIDFVLRILLAAIGIAAIAGPMGSIVLWRRMVFFGDTISHAALLGVALSLAVDMPVTVGVVVVALCVSLIILTAQGRLHHNDTLLGVAAHSALALGLVAVPMTGVNVDLMSYLIGDILSVSWADTAIIWVGVLICMALLRWRWRGLLLTSLDRDLALAAGFDARRESVWFTIALAVLVAVSIKVVGALLVTALLIIPAAAARMTAQTPERMVVNASILGGLSAMIGVAASFWFDAPTGPSIVVGALVLMIFASLWRRFAS